MIKQHKEKMAFSKVCQVGKLSWAGNVRLLRPKAERAVEQGAGCVLWHVQRHIVLHGVLPHPHVAEKSLGKMVPTTTCQARFWRTRLFL